MTGRKGARDQATRLAPRSSKRLGSVSSTSAPADGRHPERRERDEEAARIKHDEELYERKMELKLLKSQKDRDDEAARHKAEEERLKKEWELKQEREERKERMARVEEERRACKEQE